jgi:hypothetical protein
MSLQHPYATFQPAPGWGGDDTDERQTHIMFKKERDTARPWRRPLAIGAALAVTAGMSVGFTMAANASGGGSTTDVTFVPVSPAYKLLTAKSMTTNSSLNEVVSGAKTTVPTDATTVELNVEAGGTTAGIMNFHPTGNLVGGSGQFLSWTAGSTASQTIEENVGASDELTFALTGGTAKVTATITGYSTQVTDGDVSGLDGTSGQVLTDNGSGAAWANPQGGSAAADGDSGIYPLTDNSNTLVASVTEPAGTYFVSYTGDVDNSSASLDIVTCILQSPNGAYMQSEGLQMAADTTTMLPLQGLDTTTGGTFSVQCYDSKGTGYVGDNDNVESLVAVQLSSAGGYVANGRNHAAGVSKIRGLKSNP